MKVVLLSIKKIKVLLSRTSEVTTTTDTTTTKTTTTTPVPIAAISSSEKPIVTQRETPSVFEGTLFCQK